MEDLGRLGFWLAAGFVLAVYIVTEALKQRDKERERHATIREMMRLEAEGKLTPETLAFMRASDPLTAVMGASGNESPAWGVGFLAFLGGFMAAIFGFTSTNSWEVPVSLMLGIWVGGGLIAGLLHVLFWGKKKNDPPPGA